jgi:hypothetical protein
MKQNHALAKAITPQEIHLLEQLRQHPELFDRVQSLLEIVGHAEGPLQTADQVEAALIEEMRRLGSVTMHQWAIQAEARVSTELQHQNPTVLSRKKKRSNGGVSSGSCR